MLFMQAARNSGSNCARLLRLVKLCDRQLAAVTRGRLTKCKSTCNGGKGSGKEAGRGFRELAAALLAAGRFLRAYSGRGFIVRFLTCRDDAARFKALEARIRGAMQVGGQLQSQALDALITTDLCADLLACDIDA